VTAFDEGERRAWAGRAEAYAASFGKLCAFPVSQLLDAVGVQAGIEMLDVGTGPGTVAAAAAERGARITGVDAEPDMIELASLAVPGADLRVAALPHLPFPDDAFDAVTGNFVLNHVGRPLAALRELRRVTRPGGRIALTICSGPPGAGAQLLGRAVQASGATRPAHLRPLPPEQDFERDEQGFAALLATAGLGGVECRTLARDHRATAEEWWSGPAAGVASVGQILMNSPPQTVADIRDHFDRFSAEFLGPDGRLVLPHRALLASGCAWTPAR
jgi:SAM-dependent methyltransferase